MSAFVSCSSFLSLSSIFSLRFCVSKSLPFRYSARSLSFFFSRKQYQPAAPAAKNPAARTTPRPPTYIQRPLLLILSSNVYPYFSNSFFPSSVSAPSSFDFPVIIPANSASPAGSVSVSFAMIFASSSNLACDARRKRHPATATKQKSSPAARATLRSFPESIYTPSPLHSEYNRRQSWLSAD